MNRYLKDYILATGIPFGVFIAILRSFQHGIPMGLVTGAVAGIFLGFLCPLYWVFRIVGQINGCHPENVRKQLVFTMFETLNYFLPMIRRLISALSPLGGSKNVRSRTRIALGANLSQKQV